jgi:hypothetical protein
MDEEGVEIEQKVKDPEAIVEEKFEKRVGQLRKFYRRDRKMGGKSSTKEQINESVVKQILSSDTELGFVGYPKLGSEEDQNQAAGMIVAGLEKLSRQTLKGWAERERTGTWFTIGPNQRMLIDKINGKKEGGSG